MRHCLFCNKELKKKKRACRRLKRGYRWETAKELSERNFCDLRCRMDYQNKLMGNILASERDLRKEFTSIRSPKKYNSQWMKDNHVALLKAIYRKYGRNAWRKFLFDIGKEDMLLSDHINPLYKKHAKSLLDYWRKELDIPRRKCFEYSLKWDIPTEDKPVHAFGVYQAIQYLREKKVIRLVNRGSFRKPARYVIS